MSEVTKRASLERLLDFANKVRAAGGGNPLDALMPAVPQDSTQCLIAKNLNFNCRVDQGGIDDRESRWVMWVGDDAELAHKIASHVHCTPVFQRRVEYFGEAPKNDYGVMLPPDIGQVAADFDAGWDSFKDAFETAFEHAAEAGVVQRDAWGDPILHDELISVPTDGFDPELVKLVEEASLEAYRNATFVNPDGSIVL